MFPAFSQAEAKEDGDWEFLKSRLAKVAHVVPLRIPEMTNTFRFVPAALNFIEGAEKVTVFEGLPHQLFESELLKSERAKIEETVIGGYPFYPQQQDLSEKDERALTELLRDEKKPESVPQSQEMRWLPPGTRDPLHERRGALRSPHMLRLRRCPNPTRRQSDPRPLLRQRLGRTARRIRQAPSEVGEINRSFGFGVITKGERTRPRVLFPAPSPEIWLAIGRALIWLIGAQDLSSRQRARAHSATREGACAPRITSYPSLSGNGNGAPKGQARSRDLRSAFPRPRPELSQ